ncbi:hypothetical protein WICMUC_003278 [Wickerhamomyces mucosus]|uniref:Uncharacterized protein n=1 Tax=Wickerhamomyces mucosus TaxID=1378264 RepID=A0A9P8PLW1_9ASCO|nr:hypothetical protein WICMUC_003278 [Wickerhamomyces mucosus]
MSVVVLAVVFVAAVDVVEWIADLYDIAPAEIGVDAVMEVDVEIGAGVGVGGDVGVAAIVVAVVVEVVDSAEVVVEDFSTKLPRFVQLLEELEHSSPNT